MKEMKKQEVMKWRMRPEGLGTSIENDMHTDIQHTRHFSRRDTVPHIRIFSNKLIDRIIEGGPEFIHLEDSSTFLQSRSSQVNKNSICTSVKSPLRQITYYDERRGVSNWEIKTGSPNPKREEG